MRFGRIVVVLALGLSVLLVGLSRARATTAVVLDVETGQVLFAERADQRWYPASITKLMTAYIAFDVLGRSKRLTEQTKVGLSEIANAQEPTKLWLRTGAQLKLKTAIGAMIVKSANDAAVMVAEAVGGELAHFTRFGGCGGGKAAIDSGTPADDPMKRFFERRTGLGAARFDDASFAWSKCRYDAFIARMNSEAQRLGMTSTVFANPNGLPDPRQVTTARDYARLARALIQDFPQYAPIFAARSMRYSRGRLRSYNSLLRTFQGADGMKTGFICAAGYNIVASATRNGRRIVAVVLGWSRSSDRNARASALLAHGFRVQPSRFGPHGTSLDELPASRDVLTPPPDIRASLGSRGCRRGIRFRKRTVVVRALDTTQRSGRSSAGTNNDGTVALTAGKDKNKANNRKTASVGSKSKRTRRGKKKRSAKKAAASEKIGIAARAAVSRASER